MIKVTHIGEDYATVELFNIEHEVSLNLGQSLYLIEKNIDKTIKNLNILMDSADTGTFARDIIREIFLLLR